MTTTDRRLRIQLAWDPAGGDPIPVVTATDQALVITTPSGSTVDLYPGQAYIAREPGHHEIRARDAVGS